MCVFIRRGTLTMTKLTSEIALKSILHRYMMPRVSTSTMMIQKMMITAEMISKLNMKKLMTKMGIKATPMLRRASSIMVMYCS